MTRLYAYALFHLNINFSSMELHQRAEIVARCYKPLLRMAETLDIPIGVEATGYTLERVHEIDPEWTETLRRMIAAGQVEFIGSGYAQLIGPLVPESVVRANLDLGHEIYQSLLGLKPALALVNEQAFSAGLVRLYREAGYRAILMDWDSCAAHHPDWPKSARYYPQQAEGLRGGAIPVIWTRTLAFQKLQRYAHGELELSEYLDFVRGEMDPEGEPRALPLYGNDVEIFDYRPGRFHTEAKLEKTGEWARLEALFAAVQALPETTIIPPSAVLDLRDHPGADQRLSLQTPDHPIPVKKQPKYNITRWAVSGRDDLEANTRCHRLHQALRARDPEGWRGKDRGLWRELCYLWASDFRTHITPERWGAYKTRLGALDTLLGLAKPQRTTPDMAPLSRTAGGPVRVSTDRFIELDNDVVRVRLNPRKGLALEGMWRHGAGNVPLIGTLPHGYYDHVQYTFDWFSLGTVFDLPGRAKVTDLMPVEPEIGTDADLGAIVRARIDTPLGPIWKELSLSPDAATLKCRLTFDWPEWPRGSLRVGNLTLHPEAFDRETLDYRTHNGGGLERFPLGKANGSPSGEVDHGAPISFLVSSRCGLGLTEGVLEIGDATRRVRITVDMAEAALMGMVTHKAVGDTTFTRVSLSAQEMDETRNPIEKAHGPRAFAFAVSV